MKRFVNFLCILVVCPQVLFSQNLVSLNPGSANAGQTLNVTITGNNTYFTGGSGTSVFFEFYPGSATINSVNVLSNTSILTNITVPLNTYTGDYDVHTFGIDGYLTLEDGFHVDGVTPPSLVSVIPNNANAGQTLNVTITGSNTHFNSASSTLIYFEFYQGSSTVNSVTTLSNTSLLVNVTVPPYTFTGDYNVSIYNNLDGYITLVDGFHINGLTPPSLVSITPNSANAGNSLNVTITGADTHFSQASGTWIDFEFGQGSATVLGNALTNTSLTGFITVPPNTYTGDYDVYVSNEIDGLLALVHGFHVNGLPAPFSIYPSCGSAGDTLDVTITGNNTHFSQGSGTYVDFEFHQGSTTSLILNMLIYSDDSMMVRFRIPQATTMGDYDVYISNSLDGFLTLHDGFHVGIPMGIVKNNDPFLFLIYPNPADEKLYIELLQSNSIFKNEILIYNLQGQLLLRRPANNIKTELDIGCLAKGVYLIKIGTADRFVAKKFIKE